MDKQTAAPDRIRGVDGKAPPTPQQLNATYWQLEQSLDRVERSETHYQVLNSRRSATSEQVCAAYRQVLAALRPFYGSASPGTPDEIQKRIKRAIDRSALAVSVLTNFGKRVEYDHSLSRRPSVPVPINVSSLPWTESSDAGPLTAASQEAPRKPPEEKQAAISRDPQSVLVQDNLSIQSIAAHRPVGTRRADEKTAANRRRAERLKLSLPVQVTGYDRHHGKWQEIAKTIDVSRFGVAIQLSRRIPQGAVVHLTLPLPVKLRMHGYSAHTYHVYAIVRRLQPPQAGQRTAGLEFIGEQAPTGYFQQPWGIFHPAEWLGPDRRREVREERAEAVRIEYLNQDMKSLRYEVTATENISRSGARIIARSTPAEFDYVRVTSLVKDCSRVAVVCNRYVGKDGFERLCLNFIDAKWPL